MHLKMTSQIKKEFIISKDKDRRERFHVLRGRAVHLKEGRNSGDFKDVDHPGVIGGGSLVSFRPNPMINQKLRLINEKI